MRRLLSLARGLAAGLAVGLLLAAVGLFVAGYRPFTVLSGSMSPAIATGDVVVDSSIAPLDARVGDVVTFQDPQQHSRLITHRLRSMRVRGDNVEMVTKGDANNTVERWTVPVKGRIGKVGLRVPKAGYVLHQIGTPGGRILLIALPALLLGAYELVRIWRPSAPKEAVDGVAA